jgi:phosphatidylinositol-3-phosphatase
MMLRLLASGMLIASLTPAPQRIRHVYILVLENKAYRDTFGRRSPAPYLAHTLPSQGVLLRNYYGIGHMSLDNYIALVSGQAPNEETQLDCVTFSELRLSSPRLDAHGQALGTGCVYPPMVRMIGDQIEAAGLRWRAYMEDLGNDPAREGRGCAHPAIGAPDPTETAPASVRDQYVAWHNPFYYFHSLIDDPARCTAHVANLDRLRADLADADSTPNYVFISPNVCHDGHDATCLDGTPGGLAAVDAFLRRWIPRITSSPAFKNDGLLIVTFDEADGPLREDSTACCGERPLPGQPRQPGGVGPGGGRVGAVMLSPFIRPGTVSSQPYNHYALLRSVEDVFGLPHLGYAAEPNLRGFGADVFGPPAH